MASNVKDVLRLRKKLERNTDDYAILSVIHKLSKVPVTVDLLQDTGIGKVVRNFAKKPGKVGEKASAVLHNWRKVVAIAQKSSEHSPKISHVKHNSLKRESSDKYNMVVTNPHVPSTLSFEKKSSREKKPELKYGHKSESISFKPTDIFVKPIKMDMLHVNSKNINFEKCRLPTHVPSDMIMTDYEPHVSDIDNEELNSNRKRKDNDTYAFEDIQPKTKKQKTGSTEKSSSHNSCEKKERKSHSSNGQSSKISSKDSQSHKHENKNPDTKKLKESKTKKVKDSKKNHSDLKKTLKMQSTDAFTSSEVRFEDCLSFNDIVPVKRKKSSKSSSVMKIKVKGISEKKKPENDQLKSKHSDKSKSKHSVNPTSTKVSKPKEDKKEKEITPLAPLPTTIAIDIASTLPQPQLNYRPLPQRNFDCFPVKRKALSNEDAIKFTSSKKEKTAVYSGRKNFLTAVPTLQESATRVLIENIDAIEYLGGLPYYLLKPVLERCTPHQLENIEDYNPNLLEDTHELWEIHCKKDFRTLKPQENETWRDLYLRAFEEREKRLKAITKNISDGMSKSNTGRLVKLTYVNSYVKPPRDVARKQERNGTGLPVNHSMKAGPPSKASPRPTAPAINSAATSNAKSDYVPKNAKPKVAPLMAKTLKSMKQCFRR